MIVTYQYFLVLDTKEDNGERHIQPEFETCYTLNDGVFQSLRPHNKFEQRVPYFFPIKIGSTTAFNSMDMVPTITKAITEYEMSMDDYLFTCYGEIDIRNHIGSNGEKQNITTDESIKVCVEQYMKTILTLKDLNVVKIGVYGSPPSSPNWGSSVNEYKDEVFRNKMTLTFNEYLKEMCLKHDIIFKEITTKMLLTNGKTDSKFIMDELHLSQEAMPLLKAEFKDLQ